MSFHPAGGAGRVQALLRGLEVPILCGAREDALVLHVRTLLNGDEEEIVRAFSALEASPVGEEGRP